MKMLGVVLTGILIGFCVVTPFWTVATYVARLCLALFCGAWFYGVWCWAFPGKDEVKETWKDK